MVRLCSEWAWADEIATTAQYGRLRERYTRLEEEHADVRGRVVRAQRIEERAHALKQGGDDLRAIVMKKTGGCAEVAYWDSIRDA